ncbi:DUF3343 domain-containing protein [Maledivibacter halophilus]|uniref:Putative Se/S carrier protein-like domain-containing protein n=1 Tax=Maledivibacter halophilus TaxID=36842 RepID=A0A1T5MK11_9FIRM|nr:DUF3343 domain-containing protein [Maledivibacter halophilus]SKC88294.1 Protein of unknown function [Maledivibacter halophilus]
MEKEFYVIAFESTHYAIMIEKKLKEKYNIQTIPTPREITASCGLSIKFEGEILEDIKNELIYQKSDMNLLNIYRIIRVGNKKEAEKINWR